MDHAIVSYLSQFTVPSPFVSDVVVFLAHYLPWVVSAGFALFVLTRGKHPLSISPSKEVERLRHIAEGFGAAALAWLGSQFIRLFVERPRPFVANPDIVALIEKTSYSFPSGHAAFLFALSTIVYLYNKRAGLWFFVASLLVGVARVAAGVHYPTDILGGAALGVVVGWVVHYFVRTTPSPALPLKKEGEGKS